MCIWKLDDDPDYSVWETQCENMFMFEADGPKENGFVWCPYCGDGITIKAPSPSEDSANG
jgi:hypothetical protein